MSAHVFMVVLIAVLCMPHVLCLHICCTTLKCNVALKPVTEPNYAVPLAPSQASSTPSQNRYANTAQVCPSPAGRDILAG